MIICLFLFLDFEIQNLVLLVAGFSSWTSAGLVKDSGVFLHLTFSWIYVSWKYFCCFWMGKKNHILPLETIWASLMYKNIGAFPASFQFIDCFRILVYDSRLLYNVWTFDELSFGIFMYWWQDSSFFDISLPKIGTKFNEENWFFSGTCFMYLFLAQLISFIYFVPCLCHLNLLNFHQGLLPLIILCWYRETHIS